MRQPKRPLDALLPRTRQGILAATLMNKARWWYRSDLAKFLEIAPSSLQRELSALVEAGILRQKREGNRVYFQANPESPLVPELEGLLAKTAGLADVLREALRRHVRKIRVAFVYGSIARGEERAASDVDLIVIGSLTLSDVAPALRSAEERLGRPVNVTMYRPEEFAAKARTGQHFVREVVAGNKLFIAGDVHDLEATLERGPRRGSRHEPAGD